MKFLVENYKIFGSNARNLCDVSFLFNMHIDVRLIFINSGFEGSEIFDDLQSRLLLKDAFRLLYLFYLIFHGNNLKYFLIDIIFPEFI